MSPLIPKFAYRHRGVLVAIPLVIALLTKRNEYENEIIIWVITGIMFSVGFGLRVWAQQHLHFRLRMKMALTATGPYALVRNPIYIANTLICIAITIASEVLWLIPVTVLTCCIVYHFVVRHEEQVLVDRYGERYAGYLNQVPRWAPRLSGLSELTWSRRFLLASIRAEAYNLLFLVPLILKELMQKSA